MKKGIILISGMAVLMLLIIAPAIAAEANGQKVPASAVSQFSPYPGAPYPAPSVEEKWTTEGGIYQYRDRASYAIVTLTIDGADYPGVACNVYDAVYNSKTKVAMHRYDSKWYIGDPGDLENGFAGNIEVKLINYDRTTRTYDLETVHLVLQGFGTFEKQTLSLNFEGPMPSDPSILDIWEGYCLKG